MSIYPMIALDSVADISVNKLVEAIYPFQFAPIDNIQGFFLAIKDLCLEKIPTQGVWFVIGWFSGSVVTMFWVRKSP